jgi:hypothetical protein
MWNKGQSADEIPRRAIRFDVVNIVEYNCYDISAKFYSVSFSEEKYIHTNTYK